MINYIQDIVADPNLLDEVNDELLMELFYILSLYIEDRLENPEELDFT